MQRPGGNVETGCFWKLAQRVSYFFSRTSLGAARESPTGATGWLCGCSLHTGHNPADSSVPMREAGPGLRSHGSQFAINTAWAAPPSSNFQKNPSL